MTIQPYYIKIERRDQELVNRGYLNEKLEPGYFDYGIYKEIFMPSTTNGGSNWAILIFEPRPQILGYSSPYAGMEDALNAAIKDLNLKGFFTATIDLEKMIGDIPVNKP